MSEKMPGVDPEIKKEINEEGFEGNSAVLIGKKEELPRMLKKIESEGKTEDLGTYIKLNKEILLPWDSPVLNNEKKLKENLKDSVGDYSTFTKGKDFFDLYYIDKDGNFCLVDIDMRKIAETKKDDFPGIGEKLEDLGFTSFYDKKFLEEISSKVQVHKSYLESELRKNRKEEFDF